MPVNGTTRPEAILNPDDSQTFAQLVQWLRARARRLAGVTTAVIVNFNGTRYPNAEQMAAIKREMPMSLSGS